MNDRSSTRVMGPRAAVIGAGIGAVHIDALRRIGVTPAAILGSTPPRTREHAAKLEIPFACESLDELLSLDVDVVHVCTPNALHAGQVLAVIEAGKHVICEKPLGISVQEGERMLEAAQRAGVVHAVAYTYRYYPMVQRMRACVESGALGRLHLARGAYLNDETLRIHGSDHWMLDPAVAGPALILADIGVHWWDLVEHVTGRRIREVMCVHQAVRDSPVGDSAAGDPATDDSATDDSATGAPATGAPATGGEDSAAALLVLEDGLTATMAVSGAAAGRDNTIELEVVGTDSSLRWEQEDSDTLWQFRRGAPAWRLRRDGTELESLGIDTFQLPAGHVQGYLEAFRDLLADIYGGLARGSIDRPTYPTFADGVHGLKVLDALLRSNQTREWAAV